MLPTLGRVLAAAAKAMREARLASPSEQHRHTLHPPCEHPRFEGHHLRVVQKFFAGMLVQWRHNPRHGEHRPGAKRGWIPSQEVEVV